MQIVCKSRAQIPCENSVSNPVRAPRANSARARVKNAKNRGTPVRLYADAFAQLFLPDPALTGAGLNRNGCVLRNRLDILKRAAKRYLSSFAAESSDCSGCMWAVITRSHTVTAGFVRGGAVLPARSIFKNVYVPELFCQCLTDTSVLRCPCLTDISVCIHTYSIHICLSRICGMGDYHEGSEPADNSIKALRRKGV